MIFKHAIRFELILIATVFQIVLTMLWYSPVLFGKLWSSLTGSSIDGPPEIGRLLVGVISAVVSSTILYFIVMQLGLSGWVNGLIMGGVFITAFIIAIQLPIAVYNRTPLGLLAIDGGVFSVVILSQSVFYAVMS